MHIYIFISYASSRQSQELLYLLSFESKSKKPGTEPNRIGTVSVSTRQGLDPAKPEPEPNRIDSFRGVFIIVIVRILFFNTQFINTSVSSNKSFFIKNDEMIKSFVFVTSLTKITLFSISLYHFSRSFRQFWVFWVLNNLCEMIRFVAIKTFFRFHKFFFSRIEIKRFRDIRRSKVWRTILIEISNRCLDKRLFCFFIDRDRDRNDAYCPTDCFSRFDFDFCNNDCIRSFTRFDIVNTLIMIRFQLN
jgi:hypothetical protein